MTESRNLHSKRGSTLASRLEFHSIPEPNSGCVLWFGAISPSGYGFLGWEKRTIRAHRASWIVNFGPVPRGLHVLHKCDVRCCINPAHLFLGTHVDNMADMKAKGRENHLKGEAHGVAKLTENQVREIRMDTRNQRDIAADYGLCQATVWSIKHRIAWKHVL